MRLDEEETGEVERLLGAEEVSACIGNLAEEILGNCPAGGKLALVGIHTRGVTLARRIGERLSELGGSAVIGTLDISLYRDDLRKLDEMPLLKGSDLPFVVDGAHIVLIDDVLFTGRTVRAAIGGIMDYGRPAKIELAVLVDRGNRELPFAPNYMGKAVKTEKGDRVNVRLVGEEGEVEDGVDLIRKGGVGG